MNIACVLLFLSAGLFCYGEACRCGIVKESDRYCRAEWAMIGRVVSSTVVGGTRIYFVVVQQSLKGNTGNLAALVYTPTNGSLCGVTLEVNKDYLLAGSYHQQSLHLGLCSIAREMTDTEIVTYSPRIACQPLNHSSFNH